MVRLPYVTALTTLFSYGLLFAFGQLRDLARKILDARKPSNLKVCAAPAVLLRPGTLRILSRSPLRLTLHADSFAGLRPDLLGPRGFLHAAPLSPHSGDLSLFGNRSN
jgi:hypothetical protein